MKRHDMMMDKNFAIFFIDGTEILCYSFLLLNGENMRIFSFVHVNVIGIIEI
jgi:hypothetical protein